MVSFLAAFSMAMLVWSMISTSPTPETLRLLN
jgi:hypothetical protein